MGVSRRKYRREFKLDVLRRLDAGVSMAELARGLEINRKMLIRWREECRQAPESAFPGHGKPGGPEDRIAELERKIGQQTVEIDFLKTCWQRIEQLRRLPASIADQQSSARSAKR